MRAEILALCLVVAGCVTDGSAPPADPSQPVKIICLPMVTYSQPDQTEFAAEVERLDPYKEKQVIRFLGDYKAIRAANRAACAK